MHQFLKKKKDWLQQQLSEAFLPVHELAALLFFKNFLHRIFAADCFPNASKKTISQKKKSTVLFGPIFLPTCEVYVSKY